MSAHEFDNNQLSDEFDDSDMSDASQEVVLTGRKALLATGGSSLSATAQAQKPKQKVEDDAIFKNKQRVMLLSSRGINHRQRHLLKDLEALLPHARKDSKFDIKAEIGLLNELAELNSCNNTMYFEARKGQDLYLWLSKTPNGPSCKFLVQNVHTMDELKMTGNCLKGSRPLLSFSGEFDQHPHWQLMKQLLVHSFGTPRGHRKSKPFYDHVFQFSVLDGRIWFRNFQIVTAHESNEGARKAADAEPELVEIGPRFIMNPIRMFDGSFGGATLYENKDYISPNALRALQRRPSAEKYASRVQGNEMRKVKLAENKMPKTQRDVVNEIFK